MVLALLIVPLFITRQVFGQCGATGCDGSLPSVAAITVQEDQDVHDLAYGPWKAMAAEDKVVANSQAITVQEDQDVHDLSYGPWKAMAAEDKAVARSQAITVQEDQDVNFYGPWKAMAAEDKVVANSQAITVQEDQDVHDLAYGPWKAMAAEDKAVARSQAITVQEDQDVNFYGPWKAMAAEDKAKQMAAENDQSERKMIAVPGRLLNKDVKLWAFDSVEAMEEYIMQNPLGVAWKAESSVLGRKAKLLGKEMIPHQDVLLSCHYHDPTGPLCHVPFVSQTFWQTRVQFLDDKSIADLIFTEHKVHPLCKSACEMRYHVVELLLMSTQPVLV